MQGLREKGQQARGMGRKLGTWDIVEGREGERVSRRAQRV